MKAKPRRKFDVLEIYHYLEHKAFPGFKYNGSNKRKDNATRGRKNIPVLYQRLEQQAFQQGEDLHTHIYG